MLLCRGFGKVFNFMQPHAVFGSVEDISPSYLREKGIGGVLVDLDGTLGIGRPKVPASAAARWLKLLGGNGFPVLVLSNARDVGRVASFCRFLGLPYVARAGKPRKKAFEMASGIMGIAPERLAMVGDKRITDIWGAKKSGLYAIQVLSVRDRN